MYPHQSLVRERIDLRRHRRRKRRNSASGSQHRSSWLLRISVTKRGTRMARMTRGGDRNRSSRCSRRRIVGRGRLRGGGSSKEPHAGEIARFLRLFGTGIPLVLSIQLFSLDLSFLLCLFQLPPLAFGLPLLPSLYLLLLLEHGLFLLPFGHLDCGIIYIYDGCEAKTMECEDR